MRAAVHSLVPNLRVSPLALPPRGSLRGRGLHGRLRGGGDREETTNSYLIVGYTEREDAGSTLATDLRGPKSGVHFTARLRAAPWAARERNRRWVREPALAHCDELTMFRADVQRCAVIPQ
jgi:hypothetical protein